MKRLWQHSPSVERTPCAGPLAHFWTVLQEKWKNHLIFISSSYVSTEIVGRVALAGDGLSYDFKGQRKRETDALIRLQNTVCLLLLIFMAFRNLHHKQILFRSVFFLARLLVRLVLIPHFNIVVPNQSYSFSFFEGNTTKTLSCSSRLCSS